MGRTIATACVALASVLSLGSCARVLDDCHCDAPPEPCFSGNGACADGRCTYVADNTLSCDDGDGCTVDDRCEDGRCIASPRRCVFPPEPQCVDQDTSRFFRSRGECRDHVCHYVPEDMTCVAGCDPNTGFCAANLCRCDRPPGICYEPEGTCVDYECSYAFKARGAACDDGDACTTGDGCYRGFCTGDLDPRSCMDSPAQTCTDGQTLRWYSAQGICDSAGECEYMPTDVTCPRSCDGTACENSACSGTDECPALGARQCEFYPPAYRECRDDNADACLEWGPVVACPNGMFCKNGMCVPPGTCTMHIECTCLQGPEMGAACQALVNDDSAGFMWWQGDTGASFCTSGIVGTFPQSFGTATAHYSYCNPFEPNPQSACTCLATAECQMTVAWEGCQ